MYCVNAGLRLFAAVTVLILAVFATPRAHAVVMGTSSSLGGSTVRLVGPYYCSGVALSRRHVATAAHCANRAMRIMGGGGSAGIAGVSKSAVLDDGRRVSVTGDAVILTLTAALPVGAATIGQSDSDSFIIAGYGTTDERNRAAFGTLHEARLVAASALALVDPNRSGSISASACFGDSGGPVMRGGVLVGIITRAAHPSPRIACGHLTRWTPISVSGTASEPVLADAAADDAPPRKRSRSAKRQSSDEQVGLFAGWFVEKAETRKASRQKSAQR
ncbi:MAG TPA: trypsin-like serine protease [Rhizomicrobium sp.]